MTLARKLTLRIGALVVAAALIAGASLVGLLRLNATVATVGTEYEQLRAVYQIGHNAATARLLGRSNGADPAIGEQIARGLTETDRLIGLIEASNGARREAAEQMRRLWVNADRGADEPLNQLLGAVANMAGSINASIEAEREATRAALWGTIGVIGGLALVTLIAAGAIGWTQYRAVMRPLRGLDDAMGRVADANFAARVEPAAEAEFARLAERFNAMADRLDTMYRTLEDEVNAKSRALIRSERLAGVGYLAAGLAHEINNPLGIIGGYAEAALREPADAGRIAKALKVIAEEAFRCKAITGKLLTLARPTDAEPTAVDVGAAVERVAEMMRGLPQFAGRGVAVDVADRGSLTVTGHESELTQVMINLVANALEAVEGEGGRVEIGVGRRGPWVVVTVTDNGRGMSEGTLGRVFEPFFTDAPRRDRAGGPGTGLGLAVTHAIIAQHGGRIAAESAGEGRGSTFTVELAAAAGVEGA